MYAYLHRSPGSCKSHPFVRNFHPCCASDRKCLWGGPSIFPSAEFIDFWGTPTPLSYPVLSGHWRWLRKRRKAEPSSWLHPLWRASTFQLLLHHRVIACCATLPSPQHSLSPGLAHPAPGLYCTHSCIDSSILEQLVQGVRELSQVLFFRVSSF